MRKLDFFVIVIVLLFCLSCKEQKQNRRTEETILAYFNAIWKGDCDKAESLIYNPLYLPDYDGWKICNDTVKGKKTVLENQSALKQQHHFFLQRYSKKPNLNIIKASEVSIPFFKKNLKTGILHCLVELRTDNHIDTIYLQVLNGLTASKAEIAEVQFKPPFSKYGIKRICQ